MHRPLNNFDEIIILVRGGGDLASGVALRLQRVGLKLIISELPQPLAIRRTVSFAEAVYEHQVIIEGVTARLVEWKPPSQSPYSETFSGDDAGIIQISSALDAGEIPVIVDPDAAILSEMTIQIVIDARLTKKTPQPLQVDVPLHIGLGPGFHAGRNCHAVIETRRGHTLGRVYWDGPTQPDSGQPEGDQRRVLRAPADGQLIGYAKIGDHVEEGQVIAEIQTESGTQKIEIVSPFAGVLRGLIHPGLHVTAGLKIGDVDPRDDPAHSNLVSDKALAIGGGVLEAVFSANQIRDNLM